MFDFVEKTLHQMSLLVKLKIIISLLFAIFAGWDHRFSLYFGNFPQKVIRIIGTIRNDTLKFKIGNQIFSLCNVMLLSASQKKSQWVTQGIYTRMDFCAEPTPAASQGLDSLAATFFDAPAAHGCARTMVLSSRIFSISGSSAKY